MIEWLLSSFILKCKASALYEVSKHNAGTLYRLKFLKTMLVTTAVMNYCHVINSCEIFCYLSMMFLLYVGNENCTKVDSPV